MSNRKAFSGALYTSGLSLLINVIGVFVTPLIIRELGKEQYGEWATSLSLVNFVFILTSLGFRPLFIRRVSEDSVNISEELGTQISIRFFLGILIIFISVLMCNILNYKGNILYCVGIYSFSMFLSSLWIVFGDVLQGKQDLKTLSLVNFVAGLILTGLSVVAVLCFDGPVAVALSYLSGPIISLTLLWFIVHKKYSRVKIHWNLALIKARFLEAKLVGMSQVFAASRDRLEHLLVPKLVGTENYGLFSASTVPNERLGVVSTSLGDAFFAPIARAAKESEEAVLDQVYHLLLAAFLFCISLALMLAFLSSLIASILLPLSIGESKDIIVITVWSLPLLALWQAMIVSLQATEAHDEAAKANLWTTGISILVASLLIFRLGLIGAAISQITRPMIGCLMYFNVFRKRFLKVIFRFFDFKLVISITIFGVLLWIGNIYFENRVNFLMETAPWVLRKQGKIPSLEQGRSAVFIVAQMLAWVGFSLGVFLTVAGALNVIPLKALLQRLQRPRKRENL